MEVVFIISLFIITYTFVGYGFVLYVLVKIRRLFIKPKAYDLDLPSCTIIIACYNEAHLLTQKIRNTLGLSYPYGKLNFIFVTDGSTDDSPAVISQYPQLKLLHRTLREGKIAAVHRAVEFVDTDIIVFTDANTLLNQNALIEIAFCYADAKVGAVAGEKRVVIEDASDATAGEGFYWRYESKLKEWDSELHSVVGAAGELFSIRRSLYEPVPTDSILDDFMISMRIAMKGYKIAYQPLAYAMESSSSNIREELKRKIRISAGGIQSILQLKGLLNIFKYPTLSFQYISHRVLRWTVTPFLLVLLAILNIILLTLEPQVMHYIAGMLQVLFYLLATIGYLTEKQQTRIKAFFIPYYFCMMNYAVIAGIIKFFTTGQSAAWDKAARKEMPLTTAN